MEVLKNDDAKVDDAVFQCVERRNETIFGIFSMEKIELNEIA
jgi:hypothetical protein